MVTHDSSNHWGVTVKPNPMHGHSSHSGVTAKYSSLPPKTQKRMVTLDDSSNHWGVTALRFELSYTQISQNLTDFSPQVKWKGDPEQTQNKSHNGLFYVI